MRGWWLTDAGPYHAGVQRLVADLNAAVRDFPALHEADFETGGFSWVDASVQFCRISGEEPANRASDGMRNNLPL